MKSPLLACSTTILSASSLMLGMACAASTLINFNNFPGADNQLGTGDDVAINPGGGLAVLFAYEYSQLPGGVGLVVDSPVGGNPNAGYVNNLGAVYRSGGNNLLVAARPDAGAGQFSFAALRYRFVSSADGATAVTVRQFQFDFVRNIAAEATDTAKFYDSGGSLLATILFVDNPANNNTVFYANPAGIARVDISTTFSVATDNVVLFTEVPEASTWAAIGAVSFALCRQVRRRRGVA